MKTEAIKGYLIPSAGALLYVLCLILFYDDPEPWSVRALGAFAVLFAFAFYKGLSWAWRTPAPRPLALFFPFIALLPIGLTLAGSPIAPGFAIAPFFMVLFLWGLRLGLASQPPVTAAFALPLSTMALHSVSLTMASLKTGFIVALYLIISAVLLAVVTYPLWPVARHTKPGH